MLKLCLFGTPQILWQGSPFKVDRSKNRALLFALSTHLQPISRQRLNLLFYPEAAQSTARRKVTKLISALRSALPNPELLLSNEEQVWLHSKKVQSDTAQFAALSAYQLIEPLAAAVDLYSGPFLQDFRVPKCPEFDVWMEEERRSFEVIKGDCLETLIYLHNEQRAPHSDSQDINAAIRYAKLLVALDPLKEAAQYQLIYRLAVAGKHDEALHQYQSYCEHLENDQIEPSPSVRSLLEQIFNRSEPSPPPSIIPPITDRALDAAAAHSVRAELHHAVGQSGHRSLSKKRSRATIQAKGSNPKITHSDPCSAVFVGREDELRLLRRLYSGAIHGKGHIALISGETGVGKTALVEEAITQSSLPKGSSGEVLLVRGEAYPGSYSLPYSLLLEAFRSALVHPKSTRQIFTQLSPLIQSNLVTLLPETHGFVQTQTLPTQAQRIQVANLADSATSTQTDKFEALIQLLFVLESENQCVIVQLENLQWADKQSLDWLSYVGRKITNHKILIIGTLNDNRTRLSLPWFSSASDATTDIDNMRYSLLQQECVTEIGLEGFTELEVQALLQYEETTWANAGDKGAASWGSTLHQMCGGNPALLKTVQDVIRCDNIHFGNLESGFSLDAQALDWRKVAQNAALQEKANSILLSLSVESRSLLLTAAVSGPIVDLSELQQISTWPGAKLSAPLSELITQNLITVDADQLKFRHEILRLALSEYIHPAQKNLLTFQRHNGQLL